MDMDNQGMNYSARAMGAKMTPAKMANKRESATVIVVEKDGANKMYGGAMSYFLWFVVATIVAWFLLWALRPEWLRRRHDESSDESSDSNHGRDHRHDDHRHDHGRLFGAAIILGIIFVIFVWLFRWSCGNAW
jgi:ABC-type nickel/cobalt efflux system permease component RcnA